MTGTIRIERNGAIGTLVIDNEAKRNAMDLAMYSAVPAAVASLAADPELRAIVLRGAGDVAFGAGSDISEFRAQRTGGRAEHYNAGEAAAARAIEAIPVPVVAAIHGSCMGGGVGLALCADLRYAADDARFAVTPARLGVGYPPDAMARLCAVVGVAQAKELVFTARVVDAEEAAHIGLVNRVVPKAELDAHVEQLVAGISALAPLTLRAAKAAAHDATSALAQDAALACYHSEDFLEGIDAHLERRPPQFRGR